ncbi:hypothetical protein J132_07419 [Termitomyces sp. J132]|nr:hypothetical protein J132_07419 [Termitomyces sp. J132]
MDLGPNLSNVSIPTSHAEILARIQILEEEQQELEDNDTMEGGELPLEQVPMEDVPSHGPHEVEENHTAHVDGLPLSAATADFNLPSAYECHIERIDCFGNLTAHIVHTTGVHYITGVACKCSGQDVWFKNLIHSQLIPSTFNWMRTYFTTPVLDNFCLTDLKGKASAYQYWQKLVRITSSIASSD